MLNVTCVTTFHEPGLKQYGQRFIDSFSKQVDTNGIFSKTSSENSEKST